MTPTDIVGIVLALAIWLGLVALLAHGVWEYIRRNRRR